jgi:hypothetical protein
VMKLDEGYDLIFGRVELEPHCFGHGTESLLTRLYRPGPNRSGTIPHSTIIPIIIFTGLASPHNWWFGKLTFLQVELASDGTERVALVDVPCGVISTSKLAVPGRHSQTLIFTQITGWKRSKM